MCTVFTHAFVALALGGACYGSYGSHRSNRAPMPARFWLLAPLCSVGPDLDVVLFSFGVEYGDLWGHRGMTHALLFAAAVSITVVTLFFRSFAGGRPSRWCSLLAFFFVITASHGFLDAFTDGGLGIAFFSPLDRSRYFMPWQPLPVPYFDARSLFTPYGAKMLSLEFVYVWVPVTILAVGIWLARRVRG